MPKLTIDDIPVEVPPGTNVLEAAKRIGIIIPHFCYHEALGAVGACRLCAMKFLEGPVKGIQMSCMIPAQDGMVVSTVDPEAMRMRQLVIEWLMMNHPHDCPVCDEGGECLLQDYTVAGGHGNRRFKGNKRTFLNQYLGPHIQHEMNRCIECYRCVRFYQEYAGGTDLGTLGSAGRVYFGRFADGLLESPFSGNLLDICPTGVYTDKTARYRARYWDYDMAPSVCPWCSLGCSTIPAARYRELLKITARRNDDVNGFFICDRGRFAHYPVSTPVRPRHPSVDGTPAGWDEALDALVLRLDEFCKMNGAESLAVVGSSRLPMEGAILLHRLAEAIGAGYVCHFANEAESELVAAVTEMPVDRLASLADVRDADVIVIADVDVSVEGAMLGLSVRQAWRKGGRIFASDARLAQSLEKTLSVKVSPIQSVGNVHLEEAKRPVVICGGSAGKADVVREAARTGAKIACVLAGPTSFGAGLLARQHGAVSFAEAAATGKVKGIVAFEADIPAYWLERVPVLAAVDWMPTQVVAKAEVFFPSTAWVEMDGTFINNEGRIQRFARVMKAGMPVRGFSPDVHPPHMPRMDVPGGDVRPAWEVLTHILERLTGEPLTEPFAGPWKFLQDVDPWGNGIRCQGMETKG